MKRIFKKCMKKYVVISLLVMMSFLFLLPQAEILAQSETTASPEITGESEILTETKLENKKNIVLPVNEIKIRKKVVVTATAYNAVPWQTDDTPCIAADGTNVCANPDLNIIAANWLPFGTKVRIPEYFGDTIFEVHDRMNKRYSDRVDILMKSIPEAKQFGRRQIELEIL